MPAQVASALVVVEPELTFQLAVVELHHPAKARQLHEALGGRVGGEGGKPAVARTLGALRPLDDEPRLAPGKVVAPDWVGGPDAHEGEASGALLPARAGGEGDLAEGLGGQRPGQLERGAVG